MDNKAKHLTYSVCNHIYVQRIGNTAIYIDQRQGYYIKLPWDVHEWVISEEKADIVNLEVLQYLNTIILKLIDSGFIELDLTKVQLGKAFIYIPKGTLPVHEKVDFINLYIDNNSILNILWEKGFANYNTTINLIASPNIQYTEDFSISGWVIINSYQLLSSLMNVRCRGIRVESHEAPKEKDVKLLMDIIEKHHVYISLPYLLSKDVTSDIFEKITKINHKNLSISYDYCNMHSEPLTEDLKDKSFLVLPGVSHQALKRVKISCGAGINRFFIDSLGDIYPCYRLKCSKPIGNVYSDLPINIINSRKLIDSNILNKCQSCDVKYFCSSGCKAEYEDSGYLFCHDIKKVLEHELELNDAGGE